MFKTLLQKITSAQHFSSHENPSPWGCWEALELGGHFAAGAAAAAAVQLPGEILALAGVVVAVVDTVVVADVVDVVDAVVVGTPWDHHGGLGVLLSHSPGHLAVGA